MNTYTILYIVSFNGILVGVSRWPRGSQAWVCGHSLTGIARSNSAGGGMNVCLVECCYQVEVSATGRSLVQGSRTECAGGTECGQVQQ